MNWPAKDYLTCMSFHPHSDGIEALLCHLWEYGWLGEGEEDPDPAV